MEQTKGTGYPRNQTWKKEDDKLRRGLLFSSGPGIILSAARCQGSVPRLVGSQRQLVVTGRQPVRETGRAGDQCVAYFTEFQPGEQLQHGPTGNRVIILRLSAGPDDLTSSFLKAFFMTGYCTSMPGPSAAFHCCKNAVTQHNFQILSPPSPSLFSFLSLLYSFPSPLFSLMSSFTLFSLLSLLSFPRSTSLSPMSAHGSQYFLRTDSYCAIWRSKDSHILSGAKCLTKDLVVPIHC